MVELGVEIFSFCFLIIELYLFNEKNTLFFEIILFTPYFWYYTILKKNDSVGRCHSWIVDLFGLYHKKLGILYLVTHFDQRHSILGEAWEKVTCRASSNSNSGNMFLSRLGLYKIL